MSNHVAIFSELNLGDGKVTVAVKDCIDIAGERTCGGSAALEHSEPAEKHASVVTALLNGDSRIVGKANMHELAYGVTGINAWTRSPVNPRFPDRVPGGSSSGSAVAVAEGLVDFSIGTDTGGSIRTPAACCGVYGLKPTFARVSREGAWPRQSSLDCIGPMALSMAAIEQAMAMIAPGYQPRADFAPRYALIRTDGVEPAVQQAFDEAIARFDAPVSEHRLEGLQAAYVANMAVIAAETYAAFGHLAGHGKLGADVEARLVAAGSVDADRLAAAEIVRAAFREEVDALLVDHDVLILPTMPCFPLAVADASDAVAALRMTALVRPFNLSGHPALSVPFLAAEGLPVGIQVVGRMGDDETVCAVGRMIERRISPLSSSAHKDDN